MADYALLVDINKYPTCPLDGCSNDIRDVIDFIINKRSFDRHGIQLLSDERATAKVILSLCEWLVTKARAGDRVLFYFSGHGAEVPSKSGDDDPDGLNQIICPVDFDWTSERMVTDKQLHAIFIRFVPGVRFNWVSDSCHSGDLTREFPYDVTGRAHINKARAFPVPHDIAWHIKLAKEKFKPRVLREELQVGFISGCRYDQTSADAVFGSRPNGALSYYLLKNLYNVPATTPIISLTSLTAAALQNNHYEQEPQYEGLQSQLSFL